MSHKIPNKYTVPNKEIKFVVVTTNIKLSTNDTRTTFIFDLSHRAWSIPLFMLYKGILFDPQFSKVNRLGFAPSNILSSKYPRM